MDTDSAYLAISAESIDDIIKPEIQDEYESDKCDWFPRTDRAEHAKYDKRIPGLFKVEWEGSVRRIVVLGVRKINIAARV